MAMGKYPRTPTLEFLSDVLTSLPSSGSRGILESPLLHSFIVELVSRAFSWTVPTFFSGWTFHAVSRGPLQEYDD